MNPHLNLQTVGLSLLAIAASYAIGSIPVGYLLTRWRKGIDIRTVGSGNLGATNVGRVLGFRYFLIVLLLDMLKGLVPTLSFPWLVGKAAGSPPADLPVLVALAAILGHNFPMYLRFRGGKGVSTSLGCVLALDAASCGFAAIAFTGVLVVTRYMSLASLVGGVAFAIAHLVREPEPLGREQLALSAFSVAVPVLMIARHRKNLARIWAGTESRVELRWRKRPPEPTQPGGYIAQRALCALAVLAMLVLVGGIWFIHHASAPSELSAGPWTFREVDRVITGQQRAERVAFAPGSNRFVVTCPRYDGVIIYRVGAQKKLETVKEIELPGRPVAVAAIPGRFLVLERPPGDERHVAPGWWHAFDLDGNPVSRRRVTGYYPDDMAVSPDGKYVFVISSGRAEGGPKKPLPALEVFALDADARECRVAGRLEFDAGDDLDRLALAASGTAAAVLLPRTSQTAAIDLAVPESPRMIGRLPLGPSDTPYISHSSESESDWILMPVASRCAAVALERPHDTDGSNDRRDQSALPRADFLICARQDESTLELLQVRPACALGRLPLRGSFNLGRTRPTGLAYSAELGFLAVATRSGAIHLIEVEARASAQNDTRPQVAVGVETTPRR